MNFVASGADASLRRASIGDVFVMCHKPERRLASHLAFFTGQGLLHIHPAAAIARVTEHSIDDYWAQCVLSVYRFRGVQG